MRHTAPEVEYYNDFSAKLISDFYNGNPRIESAIRFACNKLAEHPKKRILDLGFGLGWSSFELARLFPGTTVTGADLSPRLVELASSIFGMSNQALKFICQDLTDEKWVNQHRGNYDACVMLDVYEHIPKHERPSFHRSLNSVLSDDAILIITCPSPLHQDFLRENEPESLQPIDEDVTLEDAINLAEDINGKLVHFEYKSIWNTNDYIYIAISRNLTREYRSKKMREVNLTPKLKRIHLLKKSTVSQENKIRIPSYLSLFPLASRLVNRIKRFI